MIGVSVIFDANLDSFPGQSGARSLTLRSVDQAKAFFGLSHSIDELFYGYELEDGENTFQANVALNGVQLKRVIFYSETHPEMLPVLQWELSVCGFEGEVLTYKEFLKLPKL